MLEGTGKCWTGACFMGLSLDELADIARQATGRQVTVLRDLSLDQLRTELRQSNDPRRRYIANFQRAPLFTQGSAGRATIRGDWALC